MQFWIPLIAFAGLFVMGAPYSSSPESAPQGSILEKQVLELAGSYDGLAPAQRRLVDNWFQQYNEILRKDVVARDGYQELPISTRTTFEAITHALFKSELTDDEGRSLGTALDLVDQLEAVRGKVPHARGDAQFRLYVLLRPDAVSALDRSLEFSRHHDNTHFHLEYPRNYRQDGVPSIQFSISEHGVRADIDVDYRSSFFLFALFDGHLTAANSDVRAGNNYARHVNRWSDFMGWWQHLFGLNLSRVPEDIRESVFDEVLPVVARVDGGYPLVVAVEDFFSSWLVQRTPQKAMPYVAEAAYSCVAEYEPGAENLGLAPIRILRHMLDASEAVGRVAHLEDAIDGVPLTDDENLTPVTQKYSDQFTVYEIPSSMTAAWMCPSPGRESTMAARHKGQHFAVSFRLRDKTGSAKHLAQIWKKDGGDWKLVAFHVEPEGHLGPLDDIPSVAAEHSDPASRSPQGVLEDQDVLKPVDDFLTSWLLRGEIGDAMEYFSDTAAACAPLLAEEPGEAEKSKHAATLSGWLEEVARITGPVSILSEAIQGAHPWHGDLRVLPHPSQDAFVLTSWPDDMAEEFQCGNRQAIREKKAPPQSGHHGPFYAAAFRLRTAGDHSPVLRFLWTKEDDEWRIASYGVLTH